MFKTLKHTLANRSHSLSDMPAGLTQRRLEMVWLEHRGVSVWRVQNSTGLLKVQEQLRCFLFFVSKEREKTHRVILLRCTLQRQRLQLFLCKNQTLSRTYQAHTVICETIPLSSYTNKLQGRFLPRCTVVYI